MATQIAKAFHKCFQILILIPSLQLRVSHIKKGKMPCLLLPHPPLQTHPPLPPLLLLSPPPPPPHLPLTQTPPAIPVSLWRKYHKTL